MPAYIVSDLLHGLEAIEFDAECAGDSERAAMVRNLAIVVRAGRMPSPTAPGNVLSLFRRELWNLAEIYSDKRQSSRANKCRDLIAALS